MRTSELLAKVEMVPVSKARNLGEIGWADGYLVVRYKGRPTLYVYGPAIAEAERDKLLKVPYPDKLINQLKAKYGWQCHKVETHAA